MLRQFGRHLWPKVLRRTRYCQVAHWPCSPVQRPPGQTRPKGKSQATSSRTRLTVAQVILAQPLQRGRMLLHKARLAKDAPDSLACTNSAAKTDAWTQPRVLGWQPQSPLSSCGGELRSRSAPAAAWPPPGCPHQQSRFRSWIQGRSSAAVSSASLLTGHSSTFCRC